jgi:hypothetical protein
VRKTAAITYYGHYYRVPEEYIKRTVWTKLKGSTLIIECGGEAIARHESLKIFFTPCILIPSLLDKLKYFQAGPKGEGAASQSR